MNKTKSKKANGAAHPALDSNVAAKANGHVKIDPHMVTTLNYLIQARDGHGRAYQQAQETINANLKHWAESKGLKPEEFEFNDEKLAFVPKK